MSKDNSSPNPSDIIDWVKALNTNQQTSKGDPSFSYSISYQFLFKRRSTTIDMIDLKSNTTVINESR